LAFNLAAGRRIPAEHWRDAAQQGRIAGLTAAGYPAAWHMVPGFSCTIGEFTLKYRGWGTGYEHSRLVAAYGLIRQAGISHICPDTSAHGAKASRGA
jgi:hypothetical protein